AIERTWMDWILAICNPELIGWGRAQLLPLIEEARAPP
ncbi:hypothetical protein L195_g047522, partial [Trifolium pratense]